MGRPPLIPYDEIPKMKFGRLTPIRIANENGRVKWLCQCDCGNYTEVIQKNLCNGNTKSCGCLAREINPKRTHGLSGKRIYVLYLGLKGRCYNPTNSSYKWYGEKGVRMCDEWKNDPEAFAKWSYESGYDENLPRGVQTIDRIDPNGDYCPENCRWITIQEQQRNKTNLKLYEYNGEKHLLCEWAEILGIDFDFLRSRVCDYNYSLQEAICSPKNEKLKRNLIKLTHRGKTMTVSQWSKELGISESTIRNRIKKTDDTNYILRTKKG